ncbi:ATP phosphoribosyltransferase regulatory subunit [Rhodovastum atsumiense]|uniref:ATP phosphoribosyltransferase regulatory subunit n=1 Tax=Rhodovastum atsumiense TaxID=504468 RepID=A0A5M6J2M2_9PROT|nr:ATP phosphoribosyltransferase regulatory subunit [Rhodovastum atsumiense]KAA5614771.1 ATP phosphoribosyltransferase regulatory subunit [Rhodovastum atsumiense]CAH2599674.1 ATP phosphoribosyltransferase regulatory subunit [Rhodovastum atsumiense]
MTDDRPLNPALLPAGLRDLLPPEAETEATSVEAIMDAFAAHGYQRVKPPLLEFEESLLGAAGAAVADQTFRLMDPDSHHMMGVRADMTPQVARIATTRLSHAPRPLRLSYAGQCLRVRSAGLATERQVAQAGIELIGPDSPDADAEIAAVGAEALAAVGLTRVSFDLTLPPFVPTLLDEAGFTAEAGASLGRALDRKDAAAVTELGGSLAGTLTDLLLAAGPAERALAALEAAALPPGARALAKRLAATVAAIRARAPGLRLTIDPVEFRGFRYHTGVTLTVYAPGRHEELGRGGRYLCGDTEPATGLTLYPDAVLRAAPPRAPKPRVYVPVEADATRAAALRAEGYATVAGLEAVADPAAEARRLACTHVLIAGGLTALAAE